MSHRNLAIICSRFNSAVTDALLTGALVRAQEWGINVEASAVYRVPGAVEIPLIAKKLAKLNHYHAIVCLGAVIRGETSHYDYVCEQVSQGCQQVMMEYEVPVIFGVLMTENEEQALARAGGVQGHKGREAIDAAVEMAKLMEGL